MQAIVADEKESNMLILAARVLEKPKRWHTLCISHSRIGPCGINSRALVNRSAAMTLRVNRDLCDEMQMESPALPPSFSILGLSAELPLSRI